MRLAARLHLKAAFDPDDAVDEIGGHVVRARRRRCTIAWTRRDALELVIRETAQPGGRLRSFERDVRRSMRRSRSRAARAGRRVSGSSFAHSPAGSYSGPSNEIGVTL